MKSVLKSVHGSRPLESVERVLSRYYPQLVEWSRILTRGDVTAAEESVQDLCLHLTVAQPDLSRIQNLDNYLFMCLRNMYVSSLARVSRERLRVLQVEDYDAVGFVAAKSGLDAVDVQNDLIRIGDYVLLRKYASKSASHFILHFFFGYRRSDVALLARLPIAAVYNSLKDVRSELRKHLSTDERIRLVQRGAHPPLELLRTPIPSDLFLQELRSTILDADSSNCVAEEELVESYKQPSASPVASRELAHLAGCERCLNILERVFLLDDRDGPLDGLHGAGDRMRETKGTRSFDATMRMVRRRREQLFERRPALLAIAVDGRVVAFHAVESAHNSMSSRVDTSPAVQFIEVFDEFGDRLAHIPFDPESSAAPQKELSQQVHLSDDRRLRLNVRFDGLGIHAQVDYLDPALAPLAALESPRPNKSRDSFRSWPWWPGKLRLAPWGAVAFASFLMASILGIAGYRFMHPVWEDVLARAQAVAPVPIQNEALHQKLLLEQTIGTQSGFVLGSVDVWRSSNNNVVRRLYDAQQHLLATSIETEDGTSSIRLESNPTSTELDRQIVESGVWRSDVSASAFATGHGMSTEASRNLSGFELTQREDGRDSILLRTLVLDRNYHLQAEKVRFRTTGGVLEIRLEQTLLQRIPDRDVPPLTFPRSREMDAPGIQRGHNLPPELRGNAAGGVGGVDLEVAVLYELFQQNADIGQPIEVSPIAGDRVRIAGTLVDAHQLATIRERVAALANSNKVDFQVYSARDAASAAHHGKTVRQELEGGAGDAPAARLVRDALLTRGLKGAALQNAEQEFRASALSHAQSALQHAYALDRLGTILRRSGPLSLFPDTRVKWAQMVERHSTAAVTELQVLHKQLDSISVGTEAIPSVDSRTIADATAFAHTSSDLRAKAQSVNEDVVKLFAGGAADLPTAQVRESIVDLRATLPLVEADRMHSFAARLTSRDTSGQNEVGEMHPR